MKIKFENKYATTFDKPQYLDCEKDMLTADELASVINAVCAGGARVTGIVRDKDAY
jgi:hypothetical protein